MTIWEWIKAFDWLFYAFVIAIVLAIIIQKGIYYIERRKKGYVAK